MASATRSTRPPLSRRRAERAVVRASRPGYAALRVVALSAAGLLLVGSGAAALPGMLQQQADVEMALPAQLTRLTIESPRGDVRVREARGDRPAVADLNLGWTLHQPQPQLVDEGDGAWRLTAQCEENNLGRCWVDMDVVVPDGAAVDVQSTFGAVRTDTTGDLDVRTTTGDIRVEGSPGRVQASTTFGDVRLTTRQDAPESVSVQTSAGDIDVEVPGDQSYQVDADSKLGKERVAVQQAAGARHTLTLDSEFGDIDVTPSD